MKKINPVIGAIWGSAIVVVFLVLYSLLKTENREAYLETCWDLAVTDCNIGKYSGHVDGTVTNNCTEKVNSVEVISELYSVNGELLFTGDPVYVENLEPGEQGEFKAIIYATDSQAAACMAHITKGY